MSNVLADVTDGLFRRLPHVMSSHSMLEMYDRCTTFTTTVQDPPRPILFGCPRQS